MRRGISSVLIALAVSAGAPGALAQGEEPSPQTEEIGLLFAQTAKRGALKPVEGKRRYALRLQGVASQVVWFTDRPARQSGHIPTRAFVRSWAGFGFGEDPPNAALTLLDAENDEDTIVLTLGAPRYKKSARTIRYPVRTLDEATGNLSHLETERDARVARRFRAASLFIDDATAPTVNGCVIQPHTWCPDINLAGANLAGADLRGAELKYTELSRANLSGANLAGADLLNTSLRYANLANANLSNANLSQANFTNATLTGANLVGVNAVRTDFGRANLRGASFPAANRNGAYYCKTIMPDGSIRTSPGYGCGTAPPGPDARGGRPRGQ